MPDYPKVHNKQNCLFEDQNRQERPVCKAPRQISYLFGIIKIFAGQFQWQQAQKILCSSGAIEFDDKLVLVGECQPDALDCAVGAV